MSVIRTTTSSLAILAAQVTLSPCIKRSALDERATFFRLAARGEDPHTFLALRWQGAVLLQHDATDRQRRRPGVPILLVDELTPIDVVDLPPHRCVQSLIARHRLLE